MFKRKTRITGVLVSALMAAFFYSTATAQQAPTSASAEPQLQEIVVTGSMIRRTDTETASPVQVVTAKDLEQSGFSTVSDVLRNLSANGQGTLSQSFNGAFASGGAGVALRGLTVGGTLTLLDGYRMVSYPLTDDGQRSFVDVSSIPFNAIERVEVLKDGASAEYGSDAIAGVVNIILRKTYTGAELNVEGGESGHNDGRMLHLSALAGTGDVSADGYNWWLTAEYRRQGDILTANRSGLWNNLDWSGYGGVNTTPGAGTNPAFPYPGSITGYLINPTTGAVGAFFPGCTRTAQLANQCIYNYAGNDLQPATTNMNLLSKFTVGLGADWQSITTASVFQSKVDQPNNGGYQTTNPPTGLLFFPFPVNGLPTVKIIPVPTVPANYPGNPYGVAAPLVYNFPELGIPQDHIQTNTYRLVEEINGHAAGWDINAAAGYMYAINDQVYTGFLDPGLFQQALNNDYSLGNSNVAGQFAPNAESTASSYLFFGNVHGTHALATLPGGDLAVAVGAEYFEKKLNATATPSSLAGTQGMSDAWSVGSQADSAAFVELNAPVVTQLEVNAALRYDHYNTSAGGDATPKIGLKYTPVKEFALRGTWGKGFRAPSIPETNSGLTFNASSASDPILCPHPAVANTPGNFPSQCAVALAGVQTSGIDLKPETTTTYTVGFVFEPAHVFSVAADYYDIKVNRDIISAFEAGGLNINAITIARGPQVQNPFVNPNGTISNMLTPVGLALYEAYPYINASETHTNGIDLDFKSLIDLGAAGRLSGELNYTHILIFTLSAPGVSYELAGTHGPSGFSGDTGNPKDRAVLSLTWDKGPVSVTGSVNYVGSFSVTDPSSGQPTCASALEARFVSEYGPGTFPAGSIFPNSFCRVASFTDVDFYGRYDVNDHISVHASVLNAFDRPPPLDLATYGGGGGAAYDAAMHQAGAVGRFFIIGAAYKF